MKSTQVYDLPTRLFHVLFALSFVSAFFISNVFDDDSPVFPYHMMIGLTMGLMVVLRIVWGILGSRYARFSSFALNPLSLVEYGRSLLSDKTKRYLGHNPASSWAALAMIVFSLGLGLTGTLMAKGTGNKSLKEVHELLANGFLIIAIAHVIGVIFHHYKHRDGIGMSMVHGHKEPVEGGSGIGSSYRLAALIFLLVLAAFSINLYQKYEPKIRALNLFGTTLQLGELENESGESKSSKTEHEEDDDDDDD